MVLWASKESVGAACDQRVELLGVVGGNLRVRLCGTGEEAVIAPGETRGVEFADGLSVLYTPDRSLRRSATVPPDQSPTPAYLVTIPVEHGFDPVRVDPGTAPMFAEVFGSAGLRLLDGVRLCDAVSDITRAHADFASRSAFYLRSVDPSLYVAAVTLVLRLRTAGEFFPSATISVRPAAG